MPYHVRKCEGEWVVCKNKAGKPGKIYGRHGNDKAKARRQQSALYMHANPTNETTSPRRRVIWDQLDKKDIKEETVTFTNCKKCHRKLGKAEEGGRDHRFGICDICAFPNGVTEASPRRKSIKYNPSARQTEQNVLQNLNLGSKLTPSDGSLNA